MEPAPDMKQQIYPYRQPEQRHEAGGRRMTWKTWLTVERWRIESQPVRVRYPNRYKVRSCQRQMKATIHTRADGTIALWVE